MSTNTMTSIEPVQSDMWSEWLLHRRHADDADSPSVEQIARRLQELEVVVNDQATEGHHTTALHAGLSVALKPACIPSATNPRGSTPGEINAQISATHRFGFQQGVFPPTQQQVVSSPSLALLRTRPGSNAMKDGRSPLGSSYVQDWSDPAPLIAIAPASWARDATPSLRKTFRRW